jgi:hypothetical protein
MKDEYENYLIIEGIISFSVVVMASIYLLYHFNWGVMVWVTGILVMLYLFTITAFSFRALFLILMTRTAKKLRFRIITGFFDQPKLVGHYRHNYWQLHFRNKETGATPIVLRTYVKLIFKEKKKYDIKKLDKEIGTVHGYKIIALKHIIRDDKNYLLMKVGGFIFSTKALKHLMDELMRINEEAAHK